MSYWDDKINHILQSTITSLVDKKVSDDVIEEVFFSWNKFHYYSYLPQHIQEKSTFIQQCVEKFAYTDFSFFPEHYKTRKYISKELYIELLKKEKITLAFALYPQDSEIILAVASLPTAMKQMTYFEPDYRSSPEVFLTLSQYNDGLFDSLWFESMHYLMDDAEFMKKLVMKNSTYYDYLSFKDKIAPDYLNLLIDTHNLELGKAYLSKCKDNNVLLRAIEKSEIYVKYLPKYLKSLIKENELIEKKDICHFLSDYFKSQSLQRQLHQELENKEHTSLKPKL